MLHIVTVVEFFFSCYILSLEGEHDKTFNANYSDSVEANPASVNSLILHNFVFVNSLLPCTKYTTYYQLKSIQNLVSVQNLWFWMFAEVCWRYVVYFKLIFGRMISAVLF